MISRRRTFVAALLGCSVITCNESVWSQPTPAAGIAATTGNLDAAGAASNSVNLPPPAQLPPSTLQALSDPAPAGLPPLPPATGAAMPALPPTTAVPPAGAAAVPLQGQAAPPVTLPSLPASADVDTAVVSPAPAAQVTTFASVPSAAAPVTSDVPPVVLPGAGTPVPNIVERAKGVVQTQEAPLVSTASGGPLLPTIPNSEVLAIKKLPFPAITPTSPLIPAPSVAETVNQKRQLTTLPGSGGDTNYAYATIGGPDGPATPLITPPSIVDPVPGHDIGKPYPPLQAVMPQPQATPLRWDEPGSAFGTPNPAETLNIYLSKSLRENPDLAAANPLPDNAEIIVLRGGQEFQGLILERGDMWRVELLNGTVVSIPGTKVSHVRKELAVPTSTPTARRKVFPPQPLYREEMTN